MTTDTKLKELIINKLTTSQYDSIEEKDPNQLYIVTDAPSFDDTITNCLTKIPQNIKLELVNGTLTLKAGSKVYVPNGFEADGTTPKFDIRTIESDTNVEPFGVDSDVFQLMFAGDSRVFSRNNFQVFSGSTAPTGQTYMVWYDTTHNLIKHTSDGGSTWSAGGDTFPISVSSTVSLSYTSIKQIFNGFGYIGSTVFALPGVKGLIPNGRNEDGTLRNFEFTISNVLTQTTTNTAGKTWGLYFNADGSFVGFSIGIYKRSIRTLSDRPTTWTSGNCIYVENENNNYINQNTSPSLVIIIADVVIGSSSITSFTPKTTFHAVDYNDLKQVELPTGSVIAYSGNTAPNGFVLCNGAAVSRTTYADLFAVIGTTYGTGDGSTTFNVPNLYHQVPLMFTDVAIGERYFGRLPNITGTSKWQGVSSVGSASGAFGRSSSSGGESYGGSGSKTITTFDFDASRSSSAYNAVTTFGSNAVIPRSLSMVYIIKY